MRLCSLAIPHCSKHSVQLPANTINYTDIIRFINWLSKMTNAGTAPDKITVFYDASCPRCVKDRRLYEKLAGAGGHSVVWFDITGQDEKLIELGIDPYKALTELHIELSNGTILSELDAYIVLMQRVWLLKPLAWLISLSIIRPWLAEQYHQRVLKRLKESGRL